MAVWLIHSRAPAEKVGSASELSKGAIRALRAQARQESVGSGDWSDLGSRANSPEDDQEIYAGQDEHQLSVGVGLEGQFGYSEGMGYVHPALGGWTFEPRENVPVEGFSEWQGEPILHPACVVTYSWGRQRVYRPWARVCLPSTSGRLPTLRQPRDTQLLTTSADPPLPTTAAPQPSPGASTRRDTSGTVRAQSIDRCLHATYISITYFRPLSQWDAPGSPFRSMGYEPFCPASFTRRHVRQYGHDDGWHGDRL